MKTLVTLSAEHLEPALNKYLSNTSDSLKMAFEASLKQKRKTKYAHSKLIIHALAQLAQEGATTDQIFQKVKNKESGYSRRHLANGIERLCLIQPTPLVRFDENSGKYSFIDPLYRAFAMALNSDEPKTTLDVSISIAIESLLAGIKKDSR
jgi:hypothetical protein